MTRSFSLSLLGLATILTAGVATAEAGKGTKKNGEHWVLGRVVSTHVNKNDATMVVQTHHHNKKGASTSQASVKQHSHRTFHVSSTTTFELIQGRQHSPTSSAAVHPGSHVAVLANGDHADHVQVLSQQHHGHRYGYSSGFVHYRHFGGGQAGAKGAAKPGKKK
jgi:hypothetical protein